MDWDENEEDGEQEYESREISGEAFIDPGDVGGGDGGSGQETVSDSADKGQIIADSLEEGTPAMPPEPSSPVAESAISQAPQNSSEGRDRIAHPLRYSPVTGDRAPANHFYLPWKPPVAEENGLPIGKELGTGDSEAGGASTMTPAKTPGISRGRYVPERDAGANDTSKPAPREDIGQPFPRVQVIVSLAATRNFFDDALEAATRQMADRFRKLALGEIELAAFRRRAEERAADYSLRGPIF